MLLEFARHDFIRQPCCLVILADYEGYGHTASRPHPYLYQELTARQVVDAVRYGIALYKAKGMAVQVIRCQAISQFLQRFILKQ
jgi:hypothetical protein